MKDFILVLHWVCLIENCGIKSQEDQDIKIKAKTFEEGSIRARSIFEKTKTNNVDHFVTSANFYEVRDTYIDDAKYITFKHPDKEKLATEYFSKTYEY